jgi:hypothetical protein
MFIQLWHASVHLYVEVTFDFGSSAVGPPTKQCCSGVSISAHPATFTRSFQLPGSIGRRAAQSSSLPRVPRMRRAQLRLHAVTGAVVPRARTSQFGVAAFISRSPFFRYRGTHKSRAVHPSVGRQFSVYRSSAKRGRQPWLECASLVEDPAIRLARAWPVRDSIGPTNLAYQRKRSGIESMGGQRRDC